VLNRHPPFNESASPPPPASRQIQIKSRRSGCHPGGPVHHSDQRKGCPRGNSYKPKRSCSPWLDCGADPFEKPSPIPATDPSAISPSARRHGFRARFSRMLLLHNAGANTQTSLGQLCGAPRRQAANAHRQANYDLFVGSLGSGASLSKISTREIADQITCSPMAAHEDGRWVTGTHKPAERPPAAHAALGS